jgi:diaminohydroxyphosphoribosylaminopyrimidine deaminase/5-amino-6-(5-phosphoribosylamino)uracil reductase
LHTGIKRVVVAMVDPFAKVHGNGIRLLREKGVRVDVGLLEAEARELNAAFITRLTQRRPFVIAKWAQSLDGRVALARVRDGAGFSTKARPVWISSEVSREAVQKLRGRMDGIIVGINTALTDNPLLTARPKSKRFVLRTATRIVVDSECRLPVKSRLMETVPVAPVLVAHAKDLSRVAERRRRELAERGAMTLGVAADKEGRPKLAALLKHLADLEYANVLLEGGPQLLASFLKQGFVDEAQVFLAPMLIGGERAPHAVGGGDIRSIAEAHRLVFAEMRRSGPDLQVTLRRASDD